MKITRKDLERAAEALEENDMQIWADSDPSQVAGMLWSALKNIRNREEEPADYEVILTVQGTLWGLVDLSLVDAGDYQVIISSRSDASLNINGAVITKMEIRLWRRTPS